MTQLDRGPQGLELYNAGVPGLERVSDRAFDRPFWTDPDVLHPGILLMHSFDGAAGQVSNVIPDLGQPGVTMNNVNLDGSGYAIRPSTASITVVGLPVIPSGHRRRVTIWGSVDLSLVTINGWHIGVRLNVAQPWDGTYWEGLINRSSSSQWDSRMGYFNGATHDAWAVAGWTWNIVTGANQFSLCVESDETEERFHTHSGTINKATSSYNSAAAGVSRKLTPYSNAGESGCRIWWFQNPSYFKVRSLMIEDVPT